MSVADYFTPFDWRNLDRGVAGHGGDQDLGSGGVMLLPDAVGNAWHPHLMVAAGKSGKIYLIDRDNMGKNDPNPDPPPYGPGDFNVLTVPASTGPGGVWGTPAFYFNLGAGVGYIYYHGIDPNPPLVYQGNPNSSLDTRAYAIHNGMIDKVPVFQSYELFPYPAGQPSISAYGLTAGTAIDWEVTFAHVLLPPGGPAFFPPPGGHAVLHAYSALGDPNNNGQMAELYNSDLFDPTGGNQRDQLGPEVRFAVPIVANGHVYVGQDYQFSVFGLFRPAIVPPPGNPNPNVTGVNETQIQLTWTNPATGPDNSRTGIKIFRSIDGGIDFAQIATVSGDATSYIDSAVDLNHMYYYKIQATNQAGDSPLSDAVGCTALAGSPVLTLDNVSSNEIDLVWIMPQTATGHYSIERSTDGGLTYTVIAAQLPGSQIRFADRSLMPGRYKYRIRAFANQAETSFAISNLVTAQIGYGQASLLYGDTFPASPPNLQANGDADFAQGAAQLTSANDQTGNVFSLHQENILNWATRFSFQSYGGTEPNYADGFSFVIQANSPSVRGAGRGGLGYQGIPNSVAIKFDTFNNEGENGSGGSTGLFFDGDRPTVPHSPGEVNVPLDASQVNLLSASVKEIELSYSYNVNDPALSVLHEEIVDTDHPNMPFTHDYLVDLPTKLGKAIGGSANAYVGFTGSTDIDLWQIQDILDWVYTASGPAAPHGLVVTSTAPDSADLMWKSTTPDEDGFQVSRSRYPNGPFTPVATLAAGVTAYQDTGLLAGTTYFYRVQAFNVDGTSGFSNVVLVCPGPHTTIDYPNGFANPSGLQANSNLYNAGFPGSGTAVGDFTAHRDIGTLRNPSMLGGVIFNSATASYTLTASGSNIWDSTDHFHYLYRPMAVTSEIVARVMSVSNTDFWTKAGLMIRANLSPGSPDAFVFETPSPDHNEPVFQWRDNQDGPTADFDNHRNNIQSAPVWLRLVRVGRDFSGYWAHDNGDGTHGLWNPIGSIHTIPGIDPTSTVFVGLALTAHNNGAIATATFDHVNLPALAPVPAQLTDYRQGEEGSLFTTSRLPIAQPWTTTFTINQFGGSSPPADGLAFVIQNDPRGARALGPGGGGLGYGPQQPGPLDAADIRNSLAIKFDLFNNVGEGINSTGIFTDGRSPTVRDPSLPPTPTPTAPDRSVDLTGSGIDLHGSHPLRVTLSYTGTTLTETITDTVTNASFSIAYEVDISSILGSETAYVGFTGATGGLTTMQYILTWTGDFCQAAVPQLQVAGFPPTSPAGSPQTFAVIMEFPDGTIDTGYRGTVHFTSSDPRAVLPDPNGDGSFTYTFTASDAGVHVFTATLVTAGNQSIIVTGVTDPAIVGIEMVQVIAEMPDHFLVTTSVDTAVAGTPFDVTVTVQDAYNNTVTGYTGTVTFSSADPYGATLPADYTFIGADNGSHTFAGGVTLYTSGSWNITAVDKSSGVSGSANVTLTPAPAVQFRIIPPASVTSDIPFDVTITALDPYGNVDTNYQGTISFSTSDPDPSVVVPAAYPFTAADAGVHAFTAGIVLVTPGDQTVMVFDINGALGISTITVMPPASPPGGRARQGTGQGGAPGGRIAEWSIAGIVQVRFARGSQPVVRSGSEHRDYMFQGNSLQGGTAKQEAALIFEGSASGLPALLRVEEAIDQLFTNEYVWPFLNLGRAL
jgi:hypothetical protein